MVSTGRIFAYLRVSTLEQDTDIQIKGIRDAGYQVKGSRVISEKVSGTIQAMQRKGFKNLVEHKLEEGDTLVVSKLDRLGRDNIDVQKTITMLMDKGIKVVSLDLPIHDLTSSEGKLMLQLMAAFAEFERNRIRERVLAGQERARELGKPIGRPEATDTTKLVQKLKAQGMSQSRVSKESGLSLSTIKRHWNK